MHPMFVKLFLEPGPDDPLADEQRRRRRAAQRARRQRCGSTVRVAARDPGRPPRR
jgi:hypothetical protein